MTLEEYAALRKLLREEARLRRQDEELAAIRKSMERGGWLSDFSSNIAGNAIWDGAVWLVRRLLRR